MCVNNNNASRKQGMYLGLASSCESPQSSGGSHGARCYRLGPSGRLAREGVNKVRADSAATVLFRGAVRDKTEWDWVENDPSKILPRTNYG